MTTRRPNRSDSAPIVVPPTSAPTLYSIAM
jgi:hypothetical protein